MSFTVIMPRSLNALSTTSTFSMRWRWKSPSTSSLPAPSFTVMSRSFGVITDDTAASRCVSNLRSRCVTMPTRSSPSTTGTPEMFFERVRSMTWRIVASGDTVIGSWITPLSNFFT